MSLLAGVHSKEASSFCFTVNTGPSLELLLVILLLPCVGEILHFGPSGLLPSFVPARKLQNFASPGQQNRVNPVGRVVGDPAIEEMPLGVSFQGANVPTLPLCDWYPL